jgi:predicted NodU family carbamoyl transferase
MKILGIRYGHSAAACVTVDGKIVANVMEERFTRIKNDGSFPEKAIKYCLEEAGISSTELDVITLPNVFVPPPVFSFFEFPGNIKIRDINSNKEEKS